MKQIYFDNNATTPPAPEVIEEMLGIMKHTWGNPSSSHKFGLKSEKVVELARTRLAQLINSEPSEIYFTSGGTESNQWVLNSIFHESKHRMLISELEHSSINSFQNNNNIASLPLAYDDIIQKLKELQSQSNDRHMPIFISQVFVNNETGVISPIQKLAQFCSNNSILIHSDAIQALGKVRIDVKKMPIDYLSFSAHKIFGPKGVGAIYVKKGSPITSWHLGSQERSLRGGTENTSAIAGFGKAAELILKMFEEKTNKEIQLRDYFETSLKRLIPNSTINGVKSKRVGNTSNFRIPGIDNDALLTFLSQRGVCISTGSACNSSAITPSYVLTRMGFSHEHAQESVRFSFSYLNTIEQVDVAVKLLALAQNIF